MSQPSASAPRPTLSGSMMGWLTGVAVSVGFYALLPYVPMYQAEIQRYFCGHWIEYATTGLFWIGIVTLIQKAIRIPSERAILAAEPLDGLTAAAGESAPQTVERIAGQLRLVARRAQRTHLVRRILEVCDYIRSRRSADGLEGQLSYLADLSAGRLHDSYALIRTITWAVPILGFLGTVIGITMAIANITPDQLEQSLGDVTAGLAVAFDTTALSLGLSMILVFGTFIIERQEQSVLDDIEDFARQQLAALFPTAEEATGPLMQAETQAAAQLLQRTETLVNWQIEEWQKALDALRDRWSGTLQKQQEYLEHALQNGLADTLASHAQQLTDVRRDFLSVFEQAATGINTQLAATQSALQQQQTAGVAALEEIWQRCHADLQASRAADAQIAQQFTTALTENVKSWQDQLQDSTHAMNGQLVELKEQGTTLLRLVEGEEQLVRLEERLTHNLEAVRVVESLEETLLNLNAAVHLLTAKTRSKAA